MRVALTFLIATVVNSCAQKSEQTKTTQDNISADSITNSANTKTNKNAGNKNLDLAILEWEKHEDSLRNEILKRKENKVLKESFLQEMYIRNVASVSNDSILVTIPFNLHGPDCGAPDCYSTDVSFSLNLGQTLIFPKKLQFQEYEYGCVEKEGKLSGSFQLLEQTDKYVIYHSVKHKRTLVLFSSGEESGAIAYYFTEIGNNRINGKNVYKIVKDYNEEDKNSIYPFTSWVLSTNEYENFLDKR